MQVILQTLVCIIECVNVWVCDHVKIRMDKCMIKCISMSLFVSGKKKCDWVNVRIYECVLCGNEFVGMFMWLNEHVSMWMYGYVLVNL